MGGGDELAVREGGSEFLDYGALPLGMEMKVEFVDQNDSSSLERISEVGIGLGEATGEIEDERQDATFTIGELTEIEGDSGFVDQQGCAGLWGRFTMFVEVIEGFALGTDVGAGVNNAGKCAGEYF